MKLLFAFAIIAVTLNSLADAAGFYWGAREFVTESYLNFVHRTPHARLPTLARRRAHMHVDEDARSREYGTGALSI